MNKYRNKKLLESAKRINKICLNCENSFSIPRCRDFREHCCSSNCKKEYREKIKLKNKLSRRRSCAECNSIFYPRQSQIENGQGIFCSNSCQVKAMVVNAHTKEANNKRRESFIKAMKGKYKSGEDHPQWTGGVDAAKERTRVKRRKNKDYFNKKLREYRAANPEKVREWKQSRSRRKNGKLPRGTVGKLHILQNGKCPICKSLLGDDYHVDHIMPLAKGGLHTKDNIQLLCKLCNIRKSAKDPIVFMQENGFLL